MPKKICIIQGHPHNDPAHLCHALAAAYEKGARAAGHMIAHINIGAMDLALLRAPDDFETDPPPQILDAQRKVKEANHVFIIYPLWLGTMPALVKAFFEQLTRHDFAIAQNASGHMPLQKLKGKSARVVVTMGMPSLAYRVVFGAHGVKSFESAVLGISGFKPIRDTLIGGVGEMNEQRALKLFTKMHRLGAKGA